MSGMNATTGQCLDGIEHLRQSVHDILTTPIGSRVMRRDYGSLLPELIDRPLTDALMLQVYAATIMALLRWEPRLHITAVHRQISPNQHGTAMLELEGITSSGTPINLEVPIV